MAFRVVGVDPGSTGGMAEITQAGDGFGQVTRTALMPWRDIGKKNKDLNLDGVIEFINADPTPCLVVVEEIGFMPGDAERAFGIIRLVAGCNQILGACKALKYRRHAVRPADWQRKVIGKVLHPKAEVPEGEETKTEAKRRKNREKKARTDRTKAAIAEVCRQLYPGAPTIPPGCRVPHDGLIDAIMIAHYGLVYVARGGI